MKKLRDMMNILLQLFKQERGSAIINVLVIGVLSTAVYVAIQNEGSRSQKTIKSHAIREDLGRVSSNFEKIMTNVNSCTGDFLTRIVTLYATGAGVTLEPGPPAMQYLDLSTVGIQNADLGYLVYPVAMGVNLGTFGRLELEYLRIGKIQEVGQPAETNFLLEMRLKLIDESGADPNNQSRSLFLAKQITKMFNFTAKLNDFGVPTGCFMDNTNNISDAVYDFCQGPGAIYNADTNECHVIGLDEVNCPDPMVMYGWWIDPVGGAGKPIAQAKCCDNSGATLTTADDCVSATLNASSCNPNEFVAGVNADGSVKCKTLTGADIAHLIKSGQIDGTAYENCSSEQLRLNVVAGKIQVECDAGGPPVGPADHLSFSTQPGSPYTENVPFSPQPVVAVLDASNNVVSTDNGTPVTLDAYDDASCTTPVSVVLTGVNPVNTLNGYSAFTNLETGVNSITFYLKASAPGLIPACSSALNYAPPPPPPPPATCSAPYASGLPYSGTPIPWSGSQPVPGSYKLDILTLAVGQTAVITNDLTPSVPTLNATCPNYNLPISGDPVTCQFGTMFSHGYVVQKSFSSGLNCRYNLAIDNHPSVRRINQGEVLAGVCQNTTLLAEDITWESSVTVVRTASGVIINGIALDVEPSATEAWVRFSSSTGNYWTGSECSSNGFGVQNTTGTVTITVTP